MPNPNATIGLREAYLEIQDGSSPTKARTLACTDLTIPNPQTATMVKTHVQGVLRSVVAGDDIEPTFEFSVPLLNYTDATQPTLDEIVGGIGLGADWTPINSSMVVQAALPTNAALTNGFRCFTFVFYLDARAQGGPWQKRTVQGWVMRSTAISRDSSGLSVYKYTGEVWGTIVDTEVTE